MEQMSPSSFSEKHSLHGRSDPIRFTAGRDVLLRAENDDIPKSRHSERVCVKTLTQYKGMQRIYGRILDARNSTVAYRIFNERTGEAVRVLGFDEQTLRVVIKDFKFQIADVQWSNGGNTLAVTDVQGNLYIYDFDREESDLGKMTRQVTIIRCHKTGDAKQRPTPRISWCPFVRPEGSDPSEDKLIVALSVGNTIDLFDINELCADGKLNFDIDEESTEMKLPGHFRMVVQKPAIAVRISPDGTAIAVATEDSIYFYVASNEPEKFKLAQAWAPSINEKIHDFVFLDDVTTPRKGINGDTFWKHSLVFFDKGRFVNIIDERWSTVGRLKISEKAAADTALLVSVDPSGRFVFLSDFEDGMVYSFEMGVAGGQMRFLSVTQITYCSNVVYNYMVPYAVSITAKPAKRSQSSDCSTSGSEGVAEIAIVDFIGLSSSSVCQLHVELDVTPVDALSIEDEENIEEEIKDSSETGSTSGAEDEQKAETSGLYVRSKSAPENKEIGKESPDEYTESTSERSASSDSAHANGYSSKDIAELTGQIADLNETVGLLTSRIEAMEEQRHQLQENMRSEMCAVLENISDEISTRDAKMVGQVDEMLKQQHAVFEKIVTSAVDSISVTSTNSVEAEMTEVCKRVINDMMCNRLVPAMEQLCSQMFESLNSRFAEGLQEYVDQVKASTAQIHSAQMAATPAQQPTDSLIGLIENGEVNRAFQIAVNSGDLSTIMFVCNKVDPDQFFALETVPLTQSCLLSLLVHLSAKLDTDVELKMKYIDYVTMALDLKEIANNLETRESLVKVSESFASIVNNERMSSTNRRSIRLLQQLITGSLN
ncbi:hypothetical protein L596_007975 [Steinernema carpocapsae]|uniref:Uncharacterized protein n=1 Tax=Steinernema carpocapsae TaxID=34508 RepID=A0A4U5PBL5_STECR|nr:hypothetical protein L596_007975 [Steinernema carpocapsae]